MHKIAAFMVVLASVIWATGGPAVKVLLNYGLTENEIFFTKAFFCVISMLLFDLICRKRIKRISSVKDFFALMICGVVGYLIYGMLYGYALHRIPISVAVVLVYTAPAIVMLISVIFFKEKFTLKKRIALVMIMTGCVFVTGILTEGIGQISFVGVLMGLASGFCFALYSIFGSIVMKKYDAWSVATYNFMFALLVTSFLVDIPQTMNKVFENIDVLLLNLYFAVFCGTIANLIYVKSLEYIEASKAAMITTIEPLTTCVAGVIFFHEDMGIIKFLGVVLILMAVIVLNYTASEKKKKRTAARKVGL